MIEIDRSRVIAFQTCPRKRWLEYHACGKGLQRRAKGLPLQFGSAFHAGAEHLLAGNLELAVKAAITWLENAFSNKGIGMDGEESSDTSLIYSAQEQMALAEGLIRGWGLERLPEFLQTFEVIEVEKEGRAYLTTDFSSTPVDGPDGEPSYKDGVHGSGIRNLHDNSLVLLFRPDALVRERLSGDHYICSWKTTSQYNKRSLMQAKTDMQSMSEMFGVEQEQGIKVEGILYLFVVKGKRQLDDYDQLWKQQSSLVYGWKKLRPIDEMGDEWAWTFKFPKEDGVGNSTLGKGWQKKPIWSDYPGGVKAWIEALHRREVFPRHIDPFDGIFPQSLPVERRGDEVQEWRDQTVAQELQVAESVAACQNGFGDLPLHFPKYSHSCHSYSGCQFIDICWNGVPAEPGELYQLRVSNHPEQEDEDGQ